MKYNEDVSMLDIAPRHPRDDTSELLMELSGSLDAEGAPQLESAVAALPEKVRTLILDMGGLVYLSSAGLRVLLQAHKNLAGRQGRLLLCNIPALVAQVLELSGMARMLSISENMHKALAQSHTTLTTAWSLETRQGQLSFTPQEGDACHLELWKDVGKQNMYQASLAELGICLGYGGFGNRRDQAMENRGVFFAGRSVAALLPDGASTHPTYLTTRYPMETVMFVSRGLSVSGDPTGCLQYEASTNISLGSFLQELDDALPAPGRRHRVEALLPRISLLFVSDLTPSAQDGAPAPGGVVICVHYHGPRSNALPPALSSLPWRRDGELNCCALALSLRTAPQTPCGASPAEGLEAVSEVENISSFCEVGPEARFTKAMVWVWNPRSLRSMQERLLQIHTSEDAKLPDAWDAITRHIYTTAWEQDHPAIARVELVPLRPILPDVGLGLFLARSFNSQGETLPPTMLAFDTASRMQRERSAYRQFVQHGLEHNGVSIEAHREQEGQAGLCYGFPGRENGDFALSTLAQHYLSLSVAELLPVFDDLFTASLKPWYGQPHLDTLRLWEEHDPQQDFPGILDAAQKELGLSPDAQGFDSPELGRRLRNPFHVLAHEFPQRRHETISWYSSVVHGDLNLHNVLLDDRRRLHVIGFHATRRGNVVSDMARLEPILLLENARLANESESDALARFMETWYAAPTYAAAPPFGYSGSDPRIAKAYQVMRRLRGYADTVTLFETDMQPYLLAVLQWTLPVVTFEHWELERKRLAAIMAGVICEQLLGESAA